MAPRRADDARKGCPHAPSAGSGCRAPSAVLVCRVAAVTDGGVVVQKAVRGGSVPAATLIRRWVRRALNGAAPGEVTVRVVDEAEIAHLNERYRGGCGATDVLAFAYGDPAGDDADSIGADAGSAVAGADPVSVDADFAGHGGNPDVADAERAFGDLVICAAVVEREARNRGKPLEAHWAHIAIHGALHLLGYDHGDAEQARVMEGRERELMEALGFGDPHAVES